MKRLTFRGANGEACINNEVQECLSEALKNTLAPIISKLADYEDAEEQDRLSISPMKIIPGTPLWVMYDTLKDAYLRKLYIYGCMGHSFVCGGEFKGEKVVCFVSFAELDLNAFLNESDADTALAAERSRI